MPRKLEEYKYIQQAILTHQRLIFQTFTFSVIASIAILSYGLQSFTGRTGVSDFVPFVILIPMAIIIPSAFIISGMRQDIFKWGAYISLEHEKGDVGYETLLDRIRDKQGRFAESYTPLFLTYWALGGVCSGLFIWRVLDVDSIHDGFSALAGFCLVILLIWSIKFLGIPQKSNRDKLKNEWNEAKKSFIGRTTTKDIDRAEANTLNDEPTLSDIMKELKGMKKSIWVTPAAFGGSIGLLGVALKIQQIPGNEFFIGLGLAFMAWCLYMVNKTRT